MAFRTSAGLVGIVDPVAFRLFLAIVSAAQPSSQLPRSNEYQDRRYGNGQDGVGEQHALERLLLRLGSAGCFSRRAA